MTHYCFNNTPESYFLHSKKQQLKSSNYSLLFICLLNFERFKQGVEANFEIKLEHNKNIIIFNNF
jgi:hypothetical protein